jgi:hypothetical protein
MSAIFATIDGNRIWMNAPRRMRSDNGQLEVLAKFEWLGCWGFRGVCFLHRHHFNRPSFNGASACSSAAPMAQILGCYLRSALVSSS